MTDSIPNNILRWTKVNKDKTPRGGYYFYPDNFRSLSTRGGRKVAEAKTNPYLEYSGGSMHGCFSIKVSDPVDESAAQREIRKYLIEFFSPLLLRPRAIVVAENTKQDFCIVHFHLLFAEIPSNEYLIPLYEEVKKILYSCVDDSENC